MLCLGVKRKEGGQHAIGLVDEISGQVVSGVDKARLEAAHGAIDYRGAFGRSALFKCQKINIEDCVHAVHRISPLDPKGTTPRLNTFVDSDLEWRVFQRHVFRGTTQQKEPV